MDAMLSLPRSRIVRGYEIRRLPLGAYLQAADALAKLPETLLTACFEGKDAAQAWSALRAMDASGLFSLLTRAMTVAPREVIRLTSTLTGVRESELLDNPDVGLDGLAELLSAFWALNRMENFLSAVRTLTEQVRTALGCSG